MGEIFNGDRRGTLTQRFKDPRYWQRIPNQNGVRDQTQATCLIHNFMVIVGADLTLVGKEDSVRQSVAVFTPVQLQLYPVLQISIAQVLQDVNRLHYSS